MAKQFIIAAPNSNAGKTTVTLGVLRLLKNKGIGVQPFKSGPDYLDPKFHELACGKQGVNLDLFMMSPQDIESSLSYFGKNTEVNCIEGVMGLFDGAVKMKGSTAELAKKLATPVFLVVDAKSIAYSVAPLIQGFKNFDTELNFAGVIFNRVGSAYHYQILKEACEDIDVPVLGYVNYLPHIKIPSRHLGLNIDGIEQFDASVEELAVAMDKTVDWKKILELSKDVLAPDHESNKSVIDFPSIRFAVAKDKAFNFIYPQTIAAMEALGSVSYFSPLDDAILPEADFVYLPGGYPESYLAELSVNCSIRDSIKKYIENKGTLFAECGGMMYLGKAIVDQKGNKFDMVNAFSFSTSLENMKLHLGYKKVNWDKSTFYGHEFHYSDVSNDSTVEHIGSIYNAREKQVNTKIYRSKNAVASYIHLYLGNKKQLIDFIKKIRA